MTPIDPDLAEAERAAERQARLVLGEDPADELPVAARLTLDDQRLEVARLSPWPRAFRPT